MKKTLVSALTTALVVGAASTTFAAANPFEDVPADHWAYDAVAQLAADGVIEGYGDGTYRGDQEITRYEMAQMVARAMAKGGASDADKAMIDKLAAEFADELNSLGVRVAALEKKVDNVKWTGTVRYRYIVDREGKKGDAEEPARNSVNYLTLRLEPEMTINDHWTGHARIDYNTNMKSAENSKGNGSIINRAGEEEVEDLVVERIWAEGNYGTTQILLGKLPYFSNADNGMIYDDNVAGAQVTFGDAVKATLTAGRAHDNGMLGKDIVNEHHKTASYQGIEVYNDRDAKFTWGAGFHHFANKDGMREAYGPNANNKFQDEDAQNIWDLGLGYKFSDLLALNGAYAWDTTADEEYVGHGNKRAWSVELDYRGADAADKGSYGIFAAYRHLGKAAVWAPTYDALDAGRKGWEFGLDYVPFKNVMATFKYSLGKTLGDAPTANANKFFTEVNFFF